MNTRNAEITQLVKDEKAHPLIVGNRVFDILPTTQELVDFTRSKYLFLQLIWRGVALPEAAEKAGLPVEDATAFKDSPKAQDYLQKKELAAIVAQEAKNPDRWWVEVHRVMEGEKVLNKGQMVVLQAQGDRVAPKRAEADGEKGKTIINFNFSAEAVKEAFRRQDVIEAELSQEQNGH